MDQKGNVSVKKKCFLAFLTNIWDPENSLLPRKKVKNGQTSEAREKVKKHTLPGTLPTTSMLINISKNA